MKLRHWVIGAITATALGSASAVTVFNVTDWGPHDPVEMDAFRYGLPGPVAFDNIYTFGLGGGVDLLSAGVSLDAPPTFNIEYGKVSLYKSDGDTDFVGDGGDIFKGAFCFDSASASALFNSLGGAGDYFYRVTGTVTGTSGGSYLLSSAMMPIPEPGTYALLLAGLGVMGFVARRRGHSIGM